MTRPPALTALLAKYGITPCGDASCMFGGASRCRCMVNVPDLIAIIRELDQQPEQIAAWLERCGCPAIAEDVRAGRWKEQDRG